ncbi:MlaC/ttg2D family ABC transporter substrate-binding protein [Celerinatantimonas diazotrophica]|uniref:Phospholipid transport system substrate-binding protein n=1 Tax=Celerinatantimonas diazotrophica TaxID=412034 RepID=A0A4R1KF34_9GAMM|nr:ABC transporter substrate-binding protein [Celerinatantimonas diazotrophica]TCK63232.1 phospholipid transport system substrate-binding protein [Celerinatantimonas diazotrophica]CAG9295601.1 Intermembrane phospholipid transport system binding protein MlaC [Celerinatantimonas diazotrophica]
MKKIPFIGLAALILLFSAASYAMQPVANTPTQNPYKTMTSVVENTFPKLQKLNSEGKLNENSARDIIINNVMPYIDYRYAAYMVIGRDLPKTTRAQREKFVKAFYTYLVNTYSQALGKYDHQKIEIARPRPFKNKQIMVVPAKILQPDGPAIHLQFKFRHLQDNKGWLAFDMIAEGVSLLSTNQSEVGGLINQKGIDAVTQMLENRQLKSDASKTMDQAQSKAANHG